MNILSLLIAIYLGILTVMAYRWRRHFVLYSCGALTAFWAVISVWP